MTYDGVFVLRHDVLGYYFVCFHFVLAAIFLLVGEIDGCIDETDDPILFPNFVNPAGIATLDLEASGVICYIWIFANFGDQF